MLLLRMYRSRAQIEMPCGFRVAKGWKEARGILTFSF